MKTDNTFPNNLIYIGKSAQENDDLVKKSHPDDVWFHLESFPSCHVILKYNEMSEITNDMIKYCCKLTKQNTKYKNVPYTKIQYIEMKYVKLTNKLGTVILQRQPKLMRV